LTLSVPHCIIGAGNTICIVVALLLAPPRQKRLPSLLQLLKNVFEEHSKKHLTFALAPPRQKPGKVKLFLRFFQRGVFHVEHPG
jgi:hypothetical protein